MKDKTVRQLKKYLEGTQASYKKYWAQKSENREQIHESHLALLRKDIDKLEVEEVYLLYFFLVGISADRKLPAFLKVEINNHIDKINQKIKKPKQQYNFDNCLIMDRLISGKTSDLEEILNKAVPIEIPANKKYEYKKSLIASRIAKCYPLDKEVARVILKKANETNDVKAKELILAAIEKRKETAIKIAKAVKTICESPNIKDVKASILFLSRTFSLELDALCADLELPTLCARLENYSQDISRMSDKKISEITGLIGIKGMEKPARDFINIQVAINYIHRQNSTDENTDAITQEPGNTNIRDTAAPPLSLGSRVYKILSNMLTFLIKSFVEMFSRQVKKDHHADAIVPSQPAHTRTFMKRNEVEEIDNINTLYGYKTKNKRENQRKDTAKPKASNT